MLGKGSQSGDTIVEVLIAIAIISFVLIAAYATANRNTLINRDLQERAQALQLAKGQLEFLRGDTALSTHNCFDSSGQPVDGAACVVDASGSPSTAASAYTIAVSPVSGANYKVVVTWASLVSNTSDNITLYYQP